MKEFQYETNVCDPSTGAAVSVSVVVEVPTGYDLSDYILEQVTEGATERLLDEVYELDTRDAD